MISTVSTLAEPHTEILGGPDIYLEEGFTMNLTCLVRDSPEPPQYIFWWVTSESLMFEAAVKINSPGTTTRSPSPTPRCGAASARSRRRGTSPPPSSLYR